MQPFEDSYDFILIDCPAPYEHSFHEIAFAACNGVIITVPAMNPVPSIVHSRILEKIHKAQIMKGECKIRAIVMGLYSEQISECHEAHSVIENIFPNDADKILKIDRDKDVEQSFAHLGKTIFEYAPLSRGAVQYEELAIRLAAKSRIGQ